ncbi:uncharacterized protein LOC119726893 [Patiria miniata]|uniref:B box-type domain-containing protein n=1 Tax=Patiria miniata TaxID=46514 RepID=A0A913ZSS2_PATMI|nr:uncharacterized protein LOC119726893 [Patiria miniata]
MAQLRSGEIVYKSKLREEVPKCSKHPEQNLNVYCNTCEQLLCTSCTLLEHRNPKHSLISLPEAAEKCKDQVAKLVAAVDKKMSAVSSAIKDINESHETLDVTYATTRDRISKKAAKEVARIKQQEQELLQDLEKNYNFRIKTFEKAEVNNSKMVAQAQHTLGVVNQLMTQERYCDILSLRQNVVGNLQDLMREKLETVSDKLAMLDFNEAEECFLGCLVLDNKPEMVVRMSTTKRWKLRIEKPRFNSEEFFNGVSGVAAFSNNEIVVVDQRREKLISFPLDAPSTQQDIPCLVRPWRVAVNKDNQLIVLDQGNVKVLDQKYQLLCQFKPGGDDLIFPTCLAVDNNNLIAVGFQRDKIALHNPDGYIIRILPAPKMERSIAISNQRVIYTSSEGLQAVDYNGTRIPAIDDTDIGNPSQVCCDSEGGIFVAVTKDLHSSQVHYYSPKGKYQGCVIKKCQTPDGMILTKDNDLILFGEKAVQIYSGVTKTKHITTFSGENSSKQYVVYSVPPCTFRSNDTDIADDECADDTMGAYWAEL